MSYPHRFGLLVVTWFLARNPSQSNVCIEDGVKLECQLKCSVWENGTLLNILTITTQMFSVDLTEQCCSWKKVTDAEGTTPSPRTKHSSWAHRDRSVRLQGEPGFTLLLYNFVCERIPSWCRLIYFGGYGCKTVREVQNASSSSFIIEEMSWVGGNYDDVERKHEPAFLWLLIICLFRQQSGTRCFDAWAGPMRWMFSTSTLQPGAHRRPR